MCIYNSKYSVAGAAFKSHGACITCYKYIHSHESGKWHVRVSCNTQSRNSDMIQYMHNNFGAKVAQITLTRLYRYVTRINDEGDFSWQAQYFGGWSMTAVAPRNVNSVSYRQGSMMRVTFRGRRNIW